MDQITEQPTAQDLARQFLMGELISAATKQMRSLDKPWLRAPEAEQKRILREVEDNIREAVYKAVQIIASDDRTRFIATVESVTFKDGVKAVLVMGNTMASHELADTATGTVIVVIENPHRYTALGDNAPRAQSDQRSIEE